MSTSVKYFSSAQSIMPVLGPTAGALQSLLKAILVDGAGAKNVQTLVVSAGVATLQFATAHNYIRDNVVQLAGGSPSEVNGDARILSVPTANSITIASAAADGTATGTITCKLPSAGWVEAFASGNVSAFKTVAAEASGMHLRVDDTGTQFARVRGFETMSDVNTGTGPTPTDALVSGGLYWRKANGVDVPPWFAFADDRALIFAVASGYWNKNYTLYRAGDYRSFQVADGWPWMVSGNMTTADDSSAKIPKGCMAAAGSEARGGAYVPRSLAGVAGALQVGRMGEAQNGSASGSTTYSGAANYANLGAGLNPANRGLLTTRVELLENGVRGTVPGIFHIRQSFANATSNGRVIDGDGELSGHRLMAINVGKPEQQTQLGMVLVDASGPWEY